MKYWSMLGIAKALYFHQIANSFFFVCQICACPAVSVSACVPAIWAWVKPVRGRSGSLVYTDLLEPAAGN